MKLATALILLAGFTLTAKAQAYIFEANAIPSTTEVSVLCTRHAAGNCVDRTLRAFDQLGCQPIALPTCQNATTAPNIDPAELSNLKGKDICVIESECRNPHFGNFGQVSCGWSNSTESALNLRQADRGLTLPVRTGFFGTWVTTLCR